MPRTAPAALAALFLSTLLLSPFPGSHAAPQTAPAAAPPIDAVVPEALVSQPSPDDELDSLAVWRRPDGGTWLIATAKSSHRLVVFDADTGERVRVVGGKGTAPGQFKRPNGIAVLGDRVFVVERDNHRVQVLSLPDFQPLGSFGERELRSPYGLWLNPAGTGGDLEVYVTDSFMDGERFDVVPPLEQLNQRVRRYALHFAQDGAPQAEAHGSFGETSAEGALRIVESIAGDPAHDRLLIADESQPHSTLREYTLAGKATGRRIPEDIFAFEAEGVSLWSCAGDRGYWVAVDQLSPLTVFHVFERDSLTRVGSIKGTRVSATDGIALYPHPTRRFPKGALFAVDNDRAIAAFDLRDVTRALRLDRACRH